MKNSIESLGRIRAQGLALLFLTFVAGILVGFAGERVLTARRARALLQPTRGALARFTDGGLPRMFQQLELTQEQPWRGLPMAGCRVCSSNSSLRRNSKSVSPLSWRTAGRAPTQ
jgi:hypothetical protein